MENKVRRKHRYKGNYVERVRTHNPLKVIALLLIAIAVVWCFIAALRTQLKESDNYISRALAARMLVLSDTDMEPSQDDDHSRWYVKYMEELEKTAAITWDNEDYIQPEYAYAALTYGELREYLLQKNWDITDIVEHTGVDVKKNKASKRIKKAVFEKLYDYMILVNGNAGGVVRRELTIVGTPASMTSAQIRQYGLWSCVAEEGCFNFEGLNMDAYSDKRICVYARGSNIVYVLAVVDESVTYHNVWLCSAQGRKIEAYISGVYREYDVSGLDKSFQNTIADIGMESGRVRQLTIKNDTISGKVLRVSNTAVELDGYGKVEIADDFRVYKNYGMLEEKSINDILVGYDLADFVVADGRICAAVLKKELHAENIRVLIMNTGFGSIFHDRVTLTSENGFTIQKGDELIKIAGGELVDIYPDSEYMSDGRLKVAPLGLNTTITVLSVERSYGNPYYSGTLEMAAEDGGLVIVNELPLEEYLYHVVPSEMPVGFGVEALKVQAVCARSYAYRHIMNNSYRAYGAHVDDSVGYQVYNNIKEQPDSTQAVKETYGQVMRSDEGVVAAYYYSTSCGYMSDLSLWGGEKGGIYKEKTVNPSGESIDLSDEESFKSFICSENAEDYDYEFPFYRWNVELDSEYLEGRINEYLKVRYLSEPGNILMKNTDGEYISSENPYIGRLISIETVQRTSSGAVRSIIIHGTDGDAMVRGELNIRYVLGPGENKIMTHTQTETSFDFLPSSYIYIEELYDDGNIAGYRITGGGYGHGIGMSQNAVSTMVKRGMRYDDILEFFYNNIDIVNIY